MQTNIQKGGFCGFQNPQTILNFPPNCVQLLLEFLKTTFKHLLGFSTTPDTIWMEVHSTEERNTDLSNVYLISSQAFSKDRTNLTILFHLSNIHNMFRHLPWSHGIWFATDTKNITITRSNFHFLSAILRESESWAQSGLKTSTPQGWRPLPSLPSSKTSPWPPPSRPSTRARKAFNPHCKAIVAA